VGHTYHTAQVIEETNTSGTMQRDYIFFAGRRIAWRDSSGNVYYDFADSIGSTRAVTNATGSVCFSADYYPYGQENGYNTSCSPTDKFAGYEYDSETGNYYAFARYYNPRLGRFMSPDPLGGSVADPQSLNRYTYVLNSPESSIDPSGMLTVSCWGTPNGEVNQGTAETVQCNDNFGDFQASYSGGPPPNFNGLDAANSFITGQTGFVWNSAGPSGGLSQQSNPGYQGGEEFKAGFNYVVGRLKKDWTKKLVEDELQQWLSHGLGYGPKGYFSSAIAGDKSALGSLKWWKGQAGVPSVPKPSASCSSIIGSIMAQWQRAIAEWEKQHPNLPPPPALLTPPNLNSACG
jgi:RHS repeat-associated protein